MSTLYGDCQKKVVRGSGLNMKFTSGLRASFKNSVSEMEGYISSLVNILGSWYVFNLLSEASTVKKIWKFEIKNVSLK